MRELKSGEQAVKGFKRVSVFYGFLEKEDNSFERLLYSGDGVQFNCPLSAMEIKGNKLIAEWENNKVEVWI